MVSPRFCLRSSRRFSIWVRIEASRAKVGSSQMRNCGSRSSARPIPTCWSWPPEHWRGRRSWNEASSPTSSSIAITPSRRSCFMPMPCAASRAVINSPIVIRPSRAETGSWNTSCTLRRRRSASPCGASQSSSLMQPPVPGELVLHEVDRPARVRRRHRQDRCPRSRRARAAASLADAQPRLAVEPARVRLRRITHPSWRRSTGRRRDDGLGARGDVGGIFDEGLGNLPGAMQRARRAFRIQEDLAGRQRGPARTGQVWPGRAAIPGASVVGSPCGAACACSASSSASDSIRPRPPDRAGRRGRRP